jgi:small subunit ribosomal protein S6
MYELTFIASPNLSEEDLKNLITELKNTITSKLGGNITKDFFSKKIALAYPIKKIKQGFLVSVDFELEKGKAESFKNAVKSSSQIIRHLIITKHPPKIAPLKAKPLKPKMIKPKIPKEKIKMEDIDKQIEEILEA